MLTSKEQVVDFIRQTIDDGNEVCIYDGKSLRDGDFPTEGVSPVYIGRIFNSAIWELEDRSGGNPLESGRIHIIRPGQTAIGSDDIVEFEIMPQVY